MSENKVRVLIVDDEQAIRRFLRVALTSKGYAVFEAASGADEEKKSKFLEAQ